MITNIDLQRLADDRRDKAVRARIWANQLSTAEDQWKLMQYAAELEAEAAELERQARAPLRTMSKC